jgi:glycosyltransferase involved in cell wall biosynthesis
MGRIIERYRTFTAAPRSEYRHDLAVTHPRYPVIPKLGMRIAPWLMYRWTEPALRRAISEGFDFDLIDAHYFYPDGVAAAMLGRRFGKPVAITARGSDINVIAQFPGARRQILWAASRAAALITVSRALKDAMIQLGIADERIRVLRNGVDLQMFHPSDRAIAREQFGFQGLTLISVGNLVAAKGHDLVIRAVRELPQINLVIVGAGPARSALEGLSQSLGVSNRVRLVGERPHAELAQLYTAVDALVLASEREGWPNVLLEAMACGTPVIATNVGGIGEIITAPEAGRIIPERTPAAIVAAVKALFAVPPAREATRAYAEKFSWDDTTNGLIALFSGLLPQAR